MKTGIRLRLYRKLKAEKIIDRCTKHSTGPPVFPVSDEIAGEKSKEK